MSEQTKSQNDKAWEALFEKYDILSHIESDGKFIISAGSVKKFVSLEENDSFLVRITI